MSLGMLTAVQLVLMAKTDGVIKDTYSGKVVGEASFW